MPADLFDRRLQRCLAPRELMGWRKGDPVGIPELEDLNNSIQFIHHGGFIGSIKGSLQDALRLARYWIQHSVSGDVYVPQLSEYKSNHIEEEVA